MTLNSLDNHDDLPLRPSAALPGQPSDRPLVDREVPIPSTDATMLMHHWLDGEMTATAVREAPGGGDLVDFWAKIDDEVEVLRTRKTPLYVQKRIMDSLPSDLYQDAAPWYQRGITVKPAVLIAGVVVLLGLGAVVASIMAR